MVDRSMEVDIIECCMIDRLLPTHKTLRFGFRRPAFSPSIRDISNAVITRDTTEHCGNIGGEVQYGYKVSEPGTYQTLGIVI